jgi:hypothetical protein
MPLKKFKSVFEGIAMMPIEVEKTASAVYAFGDELAVYRLYLKYSYGGGNPKFRYGFSENMNKWYFSIED